MALWWKKRRGNTLTVDIGSVAIKALVTTGAFPNGVSIRDFRVAYASTPSKPLGASECSKLLRDMLSQLSIVTTDVRCIISGRHCIVRIIELPHATREELRKTIGFQLSRYVPLNPDESVFDCVPLNGASSREGWQKCVLVATRRAVVDGINDTLREFNFVPLILDAEPLAVVNAFMASADAFDREHSLPHIERGGVGVLHIGMSHTDICILQGRSLVACRSIDTGELDIIKEFAAQTRVEFGDALAACSQSLDLAPDVRAVHALILGRIINEMRTSFEYCKRDYDFSCERVYITGGLADRIGIAGIAKELCGAPSYAFNPLTDQSLQALDARVRDLREVAGAFTPAFGLASRPLGF